MLPFLCTRRLLQRPLQRIQAIAMSQRPDALEVAWQEIETSFKPALNERGVSRTFLRDFCGSAGDIIPYVTLAMKVASDTNHIDDLRMLFVCAANELREHTPRFLYDLHLVAMCRSGSYNVNEVHNLLSLAETHGIVLGPLARLCAIELLIRVGADAMPLWQGTKALLQAEAERRQAHARAGLRQHPLVAEEELLIEYKLIDLTTIVLHTHYDTRWAIELCDLCRNSILRPGSKVLPRLLAAVVLDTRIDSCRIVDVLRFALQPADGAPQRLHSEEHFTKEGRVKIGQSLIRQMLQHCRYWRDDAAAAAVEQLLKDNDMIRSPGTMAMIRLARAEILALRGRMGEALDLLESDVEMEHGESKAAIMVAAEEADGSQAPAEPPATPAERSIAQSIARNAATSIDEAYNHLLARRRSGSAVNRRTLDLLLMACAAIKDEVRAAALTEEYHCVFGANLAPASFTALVSSLQPRTAVEWHRPIVALIMAAQLRPDAACLSTMMEQTLEVGDCEAALWVVKLHYLYRVPMPAATTGKLLRRLALLADHEGGNFVLATIRETKSDIDDSIITEFKSLLSESGITLT